MQNIFLNISTFGKPLKKPSTYARKSDLQYGFSQYIVRTIEAHKQKYRLFACFFSWKKKFLNFSSQNATAPPVLSGLRAKRGKEAEIPINSLPSRLERG